VEEARPEPVVQVVGGIGDGVGEVHHLGLEGPLPLVEGLEARAVGGLVGGDPLQDLVGEVEAAEAGVAHLQVGEDP